MPEKQNKIKLIYNPNAGKKKMKKRSIETTLEDLDLLLKQYQLEADFFPTKGPKHATELAKNAIKEGYDIVLAAGGDGTVSEVANGLVNSNITMGILPLGSFMNIGRMLSIPNNLEAAVAVIKIGRTRKIDAGSVTKMDGEKLAESYYFFETAGIGLDAELHEAFKELEKGNWLSAIKIVKIYLTFYAEPIKIMVDKEEKIYKNTLITISNGPYTGAAFNISPTAKLNDHKLTLSIYTMSKLELLKHFIQIRRIVTRKTSKIKVLQADDVKVITSDRHVHADASLFGCTPVSFKVIPNALNVICGFPKTDEVSAFNKRTPLDP